MLLSPVAGSDVGPGRSPDKRVVGFDALVATYAEVISERKNGQHTQERMCWLDPTTWDGYDDQPEQPTLGAD